MACPNRTVLLTSIVFLISVLLPPCVVGQSSETRQNSPNIVFILADDLGYGDLGSYNESSKIPTPNTDRLAAEGMRFTDAHAPASVCTPTRYGFLTGRDPWRNERTKKGVLNGYSSNLISTTRMTVASLLKRHGYATAMVGKWHLGLGNKEPVDYSGLLRPGPKAHGFDYFFGIPASLDHRPYVYVENERVVELPSSTTQGSERQWSGGGGFWRAGQIAPGFEHSGVLPRITEEATGFIENHLKEAPEKPFFLYFALTAPHTPWLPLEPFRGRSEAGPYGDFVAQVDDVAGRILSALDRLGVRENTLVIFTSDNGAHWPDHQIEKYGHRANKGLHGMKADVWEGGHRVPFIARWPGRIEANTTNDEVIGLTDMLATFAAIVGTELPDDAGEDSYNILPALLGETTGKPIREAIVHKSGAGMLAIRQGPWKLIEARGSGGMTDPRYIEPAASAPKGQLYNLDEDLGETNNLYQERPDVVERLSELLERYQWQGHSRAMK